MINSLIEPIVTQFRYKQITLLVIKFTFIQTIINIENQDVILLYWTNSNTV